MLERGADTLDAALHICQAREDDPNDHSVGLGGLPNEDGVVELDACVMHGPTRRAGAVGAVQNIRHAGLLAETVMRRTGHVMIVGNGAEKFAVDEGFHREDLLTDDARKIWLLWKERGVGWWGPGIDSPDWKPPVVQKPARGPMAMMLPRHPAPEDVPMVRTAMQRLLDMADRMGIRPAPATRGNTASAVADHGDHPCFRLECEGRNFWSNHDIRFGLEDCGAAGRFADYRCGLLHRSGRRFGRRDRKRRGKHQSGGSAYDRGPDAPRRYSKGSWNGSAATDRAQLQPRHD